MMTDRWIFRRKFNQNILAGLGNGRGEGSEKAILGLCLGRKLR